MPVGEAGAAGTEPGKLDDSCVDISRGTDTTDDDDDNWQESAIDEAICKKNSDGSNLGSDGKRDDSAGAIHSLL